MKEVVFLFLHDATYLLYVLKLHSTMAIYFNPKKTRYCFFFFLIRIEVLITLQWKNVFKHFEIQKRNCKHVLTVPQWSSATEGYTVARYNSSTIALHWPMSCELALSFWHFYFSGKCNTILILNPTGERQQKQVVVFYLFCSRIMSRWHQVLLHHKQIINKR